MNGRGLLLLLSLSRLRVFTWREAVESTEWQTKPDDRLIGKMFRRIERENSHIAPAAAASASRHSTRLRMFALSVCRMLHRTSDDVNEIRLISIVRRHRRQVMRNALKSPFDFFFFCRWTPFVIDGHSCHLIADVTCCYLSMRLYHTWRSHL